MANDPTAVGNSISSYVQDALDRATAASTAATQAGYPTTPQLTSDYYSGVQALQGGRGTTATQQALTDAGNVYTGYQNAGGYDQTNFAPIGQQFVTDSQYNPTTFSGADYSQSNIQAHMNPYESLVSDVAQQRLAKTYGEGQARRDDAAVRQNAFGGSGQAIADEVARRSYQDEVAQMNATNLNNAFNAGAGLVGQDWQAGQTAAASTEQSKQFGQQQQMAGVQGLLTSTQDQAAQVAAAKEAQLQALQGQSAAATQVGALGSQAQNVALSNLGALQTAGNQKTTQALNAQNYPLSVAQQEANVLSPLSGGSTSQLVTQPTTSTLQNVLGVASTAGGLLQGLGGISGIKSLLGASGGVATPEGFVKRFDGGGVVPPSGLTPQTMEALRNMSAGIIASQNLPHQPLPPHAIHPGNPMFARAMTNYRASQNIEDGAPPAPVYTSMPQSYPQTDQSGKTDGHKAGGVVSLPKPRPMSPRAPKGHGGITILIMPHH